MLEGVIKYQLHHQWQGLSEDYDLTELNAWRSLLLRLQLIGQESTRYQGLGYGNISQRLKNDEQFIITGTQTGHLAQLTRNNYAVVTAAQPGLNQLWSYGDTKPSSEALTHAVVYQQYDAIRAIIHVHCPEIWRNTKQLELACTPADVEYGTPQMAISVAKLLQSNFSDEGIFTMLGHEDGIIAFSSDLSQAACLLIKVLHQALMIEHN